MIGRNTKIIFMVEKYADGLYCPNRQTDIKRQF